MSNLGNGRYVWNPRKKTCRKLTCPLKINGWLRCISYWHSAFLGEMYGNVSCKSWTWWVSKRNLSYSRVPFSGEAYETLGGSSQIIDSCHQNSSWPHSPSSMLKSIKKWMNEWLVVFSTNWFFAPSCRLVYYQNLLIESNTYQKGLSLQGQHRIGCNQPTIGWVTNSNYGYYN